jgi:hypothetical protein
MDKLFLIVCSRDVDNDELNLLKLYGKVLQYDDCHINIPLFELIKQNESNYVLFDIRNKEHRMAISKAISNFNENNVHLVGLVRCWEKLDDFIDDSKCENCMSHLPPKQAFKYDFDTLLLEKKIREPSMAKNIMRLVSSFFNGFRN